MITLIFDIVSDFTIDNGSCSKLFEGTHSLIFDVYGCSWDYIDTCKMAHFENQITKNMMMMMQRGPSKK